MTKEEVNKRLRYINAQAVAVWLIVWVPIMGLVMFARFTTRMDLLVGTLFVSIPCFFTMYMATGVTRWYQMNELRKLSEEIDKKIHKPKET